MASGSIAVDFL